MRKERSDDSTRRWPNGSRAVMVSQKVSFLDLDGHSELAHESRKDKLIEIQPSSAAFGRWPHEGVEDIKPDRAQRQK